MVNVAEQHETDTVLAARVDARAQGGKVADAMPYLPASSTPYPPPGVDVAALTWAETVAGGKYAHKVLARGTRIKLLDVTGDPEAVLDALELLGSAMTEARRAKHGLAPRDGGNTDGDGKERAHGHRTTDHHDHAAQREGGA